MGFGINATVGTGVLVGGAFAVDTDLGMMAAGGLGAFYACAMGTYGVIGVMGLAIRPFLDDDDDEAQPQAQQKPKSMAHGALNQVSEFGSMGDREFQKIARR